MLTDVEKMLFLLLAALSVGAAAAGFRDMWRIIQRGTGQLHLDGIARRVVKALAVYLTQRTTLKARPLTSAIHWGVVLGFTWYFVVNLLDLLIGFVPDFESQLARLGGFYDGLPPVERLVERDRSGGRRLLHLAAIYAAESRGAALP